MQEGLPLPPLATSGYATALQPYHSPRAPHLQELGLSNPRLESWHIQKRQQRQMEALKAKLQVSSPHEPHSSALHPPYGLKHQISMLKSKN